MISLMVRQLGLFLALNMIIMKLILLLTKVLEKILKQALAFSTNTINGRRLAMLVWNSISMVEKEKDLVPIWKQTLFICHHQGKHLNSLYLNPTEDFWQRTQEKYHQDQVIMRMNYKQSNQEFKMPHLLCLRHPETCHFPNMELSTRT